jgi:hypothetical protein
MRVIAREYDKKNWKLWKVCRSIRSQNNTIATCASSMEHIFRQRQCVTGQKGRWSENLTTVTIKVLKFKLISRLNPLLKFKLETGFEIDLLVIEVHIIVSRLAVKYRMSYNHTLDLSADYILLLENISYDIYLYWGSWFKLYRFWLMFGKRELRILVWTL